MLYINECGTRDGQPRVVRPHPEFRLFLAMDPRHGEVSRAMRNRGIEICLLPPAPLPPAHQAPAAEQEPRQQQVEEEARSVLVSAGISGPAVLAALAQAHAETVVLCQRAHKRPPSLADLCSWGELASALLQRGWPLGKALMAAWERVYVGGQALAPAELAAAQQVLTTTCIKLGLPQQHDLVTPVTAESVSEDMETDEAAGDDSAPVDASLAVTEGLDLELDLVARSGSAVLQPGKTTLAASTLTQPCLWPQAVTGSSLAVDARLAGVLRDVALLEYSLNLAVAAHSSQQPTGPATAAALAAAGRWELLHLLPPASLAALLHSSAPVAGSASPAAGSATANHMLHQSAKVAALVLVQRSLQGDAPLRMLSVAALSQKMQQAQAAGIAAPSTSHTAQLCAALVQQLASHPVTQQLRAALQAALAASGMPADSVGLQPLDPSYSHIAEPYMPATTSEAWARCQGLWSQWQALGRHLSQGLPQQAAQQGADSAVAGSSATPFQLSYWRYLRPQERALVEAQHACIDWLYPVLSGIAELEQHLLALPVGDDISAQQQPVWTPTLAASVQAVQGWRDALWACCHPDATSTTSSDLDLEMLTWTWRRLDKALSHLSDVLPALGTSPLGARLAHVCSQMREALGLDVQPSKPLLWRLGGRPQLPRAMALLQARLQAQALAGAVHAAPAGKALDPQGRPAGLAGAGIDLLQLLQQQHEDVSEDHSVRAKVAEAVAASLACDPTLRKAAAQGMGMLALMATATQPLASDTAGNSANNNDGRAGAVVIGGAGVNNSLGGGAAAAVMREEQRQRVAQGQEVAQVLQEELSKRVQQVMDDAVQLVPLADAEIMVHMASRLGGSPTGAEDSASLLPARLMVSEACRRLQLGLLVLRDLDSLRGQQALLAAASAALLTWTAHHQAHKEGGDAMPAPQACLRTVDGLLAAARAHMADGLAGSGRSPADFMPHQQMIWILEELQDQLQAQIQASGRPKGSQDINPVLLSQWRQLHQVVLPAVLHEMWLTWHRAAWSSTVSGCLLRGRPTEPAATAGARTEGDFAPAKLLQVRECGINGVGWALS